MTWTPLAWLQLTARLALRIIGLAALWPVLAMEVAKERAGHRAAA